MLAARLSRFDRQLLPDQRTEVMQHSGGKDLAALSAELLASINPDATVEAASCHSLNLPPNADETTRQDAASTLTEQQLDQVEQDRMRAALKPFHNPKLRDAVINARRSLEQIIDEQTRDTLLRAGFDAAALETARALVTTLRQFIVDHKDEIEALQLLYSQPYRAGLRYRHVKELASKLRDAPFYVDPQEPKSVARLWQAFELVEAASRRSPPNLPLGSEKKYKAAGRHFYLVDLIALVRHALDPQQPLCLLGDTVEERFQTWLAEKEASSAPFTPDQRRWLIAIKDHIATSLSIDQDDFDSVPFNQFGGLGKAYELFGDRLAILLDELNQALLP